MPNEALEPTVLSPLRVASADKIGIIAFTKRVD